MDKSISPREIFIKSIVGASDQCRMMLEKYLGAYLMWISRKIMEKMAKKRALNKTNIYKIRVFGINSKQGIYNYE